MRAQSAASVSCNLNIGQSNRMGMLSRPHLGQAAESIAPLFMQGCARGAHLSARRPTRRGPGGRRVSWTPIRALFPHVLAFPTCEPPLSAKPTLKTTLTRFLSCRVLNTQATVATVEVCRCASFGFLPRSIHDPKAQGCAASGCTHLAQVRQASATRPTPGPWLPRPRRVTLVIVTDVLVGVARSWGGCNGLRSRGRRGRVILLRSRRALRRVCVVSLQMAWGYEKGGGTRAQGDVRGPG